MDREIREQMEALRSAGIDQVRRSTARGSPKLAMCGMAERYRVLAAVADKPVHVEKLAKRAAGPLN